MKEMEEDVTKQTFITIWKTSLNHELIKRKKTRRTDKSKTTSKCYSWKNGNLGRKNLKKQQTFIWLSQIQQPVVKQQVSLT